MRILYSLESVLASIRRGAYVVHVPESLAAEVERASFRGFVRLDAVSRPDGERTVGFVHPLRSKAIKNVMDGRFSALDLPAISYLSSVYGPRWYQLA